MDYSVLASQVLDVCLGVKRGEIVWINGWDHTQDLAEELGQESIRRGCHLLSTVQYERIWLRSLIEGPIHQLLQVPPNAKAALEQTDAYVFTLGPRSPIPWDAIPERRRSEVSVWLDTRYDKTAYAREWGRIARANRVKMLAIEATLATPERAAALGLNYERWREVMFEGCIIDHKEMAKRSKMVRKVLSGNGSVTVATPSGTSISFDLDDRPVGISDGLATEDKAAEGKVTFLPAGAIEVSVDEESANGKVVYDVPIRTGGGVVRKLTIKVKDGRVAERSAVKGGEIFERYLEGTKGDADRFAFVGIGLNPNLRHGYTQDDKVLGGVTLGLGDNQAKGGKNRAGREWWASMTRATVEVDGRVLMENGRLWI